MKTINKEITNEIEIKNSRFITIVTRITKEQISELLEKIKKQYPKATHYCYAYIINQEKRYSDDKEPTGTAGQPMLNVLEKEELNQIMAITVRYFGGIKLGAGGLVRAYTKSLTEALKCATFILLEEAYKINISFPYSEEKQVLYLLKDSNIIKKEYQEKVSLIVIIKKENLEKLQLYSYEILEEAYIEKKNS